jgi:Flp pilus assembly protein protease CpaA
MLVINTIIAASFLTLLLAASIYDIRTFKIPPWISLIIFILAAGKLILRGLSTANVTDALLGMLLGGLPMLISAIITNGDVGGGDIHLSTVCGFMLGFVRCLVGYIGLMILVLITFAAYSVIKRKKIKNQQIAFAPFIAAASAAAFLLL